MGFALGLVVRAMGNEGFAVGTRREGVETAGDTVGLAVGFDVNAGMKAVGDTLGLAVGFDVNAGVGAVGDADCDHCNNERRVESRVWSIECKGEWREDGG